MTQDHRAWGYRNGALNYVRELMGECLTSAEETAVLLHCGILTGDPVGFSEIARSLQLRSAENAERLYCQAIRKTRMSIPGSKLETWLIKARGSGHPRRKERIAIDPDLPIPRWV